MDHWHHRVYMTRTASIYRHQKELAEKEGRPFGISIEWLRALVREAMLKRCPYCDERMTMNSFSLDHELPISRGGSFGGQNLRVICRRCNEAKGSMCGYEFSELMKVVKQFEVEARADVMRRLRAGSKALRSMFWKKGRGEDSGDRKEELAADR